MGRYLSVAMVQMNIVPGDTEANVSKMLELGGGVIVDFPWVDLVCFGELIIQGYDAATWKQTAETIPGPSTDRFAALARKHSVYICPGSMFEKADGKVYNTAPVFAPDGNLVAKHRKMFPWRPLEGSEPGTEFTVFDIPDLCRVGICICYDFWFPETCRHLAWMGAEVVIHPTMTPYPLGAAERVIAQANAIQNQIYMVSVGGCGLHGGIALAGGSCIVDPDGRIVEEIGPSEGITQTVLDLDRVELAQEYGVLAEVPIMKHLLEYNHKFPMYTDGLERGEIYRNRTMPTDLSTYMARRHVVLPSAERERHPVVS